MNTYVEKRSSPSQQIEVENPVSSGKSVTFRFMNNYGGKTSTKYSDYKPAQIYRGSKWYVYYSYRNPQTGSFKRFRVYEDVNRIKDPQEKENYIQTLKLAVDYGLKNGYNPFNPTGGISIAVKNWTLNQGLSLFKQRLPDRGLRKRTIQSYESVLRMLFKELKSVLNENIDQITKRHIQAALNNSKKSNSWSNGTYNNNISFTRAIFSYLIDQEVCKENPASRIKPLPEQITKHRYFDNETFDKIKKNADPELLSFIMFLYHTGTRPNEARQLKSENILRDRKLLFIPASISKNKKDDYVPLTDYVLENYQQPGKLFDVSVNYFGQKFAELKKDLKLSKEFTLYSIKHTRAIHLAQDEVSPYDIMTLFRHSGLDVTMSYLKDLGLALKTDANKGIKF